MGFVLLDGVSSEEVREVLYELKAEAEVSLDTLRDPRKRGIVQGNVNAFDAFLTKGEVRGPLYFFLGEIERRLRAKVKSACKVCGGVLSNGRLEHPWCQAWLYQVLEEVGRDEDA